MPIENREIVFSNRELVDVLSRAQMISPKDSIETLGFLPTSDGLSKISIGIKRSSTVKTIEVAVVDIVTAVLGLLSLQEDPIASYRTQKIGGVEFRFDTARSPCCKRIGQRRR